MNEDKVWIVTVDDTPCVVVAATRSQAKWRAVSSYRDAGFGCRGEWPKVTVDRHPVSMSVLGLLLPYKNSCVSLEFLHRLAEKEAKVKP